MSSYALLIFNRLFHQQTTQAPEAENSAKIKRMKNLIQRINDSVFYCQIGGATNAHLSNRFTLEDFRLTGNLDLCKQLKAPNLQQRVIQTFKLEKSLEIISQYYPFLERIDQISSNILDSVSLLSLQKIVQATDPKKTAVSYALMENSLFLNIRTEDLTEADQVKVFKTRLAELRLNQLDAISELPRTGFAIDFEQLSAAELMAVRDQWSPAVFGLVTDDQRKSLDFSLLSSEQISHCMKGGTDDKKLVEERFTNLSSSQLIALVKKGDSKTLRHMPITSLARLPFSEMTQEQIKELFCNILDSDEVKKEKIAILPTETVNIIISILTSRNNGNDNFLFDRNSSEFLANLSDMHIANIDYSRIGKDQYSAIFLNGPEEKTRRKIALVPVAGIIQIIHNQYFGILKYISDEQLPHIDLKLVPKKYLILLFPLVNLTDFFPECNHSITRSGKLHTWKTTSGGIAQALTDEEASSLIKKNKAMCQKNFQLLSSDQFEAIKKHLNPNVLQFLGV